MQKLASDFLQKHLLRWLPPLIIALQRQPHAFYGRLADLTLEIVTSHLSLPPNHLADMNVLSPSSGNAAQLKPTTATFLPPAPPLFTDQKSSLKQMGSYLITPPLSGIYLSRHAIGTLARQQRLPRGFGSRKQMLTNLLRVGEQYEQMPNLLGALQDLLKAWQEAYTAMQSTSPHLTPFALAWLARARACSELMQEVREG